MISHRNTEKSQCRSGAVFSGCTQITQYDKWRKLHRSHALAAAFKTVSFNAKLEMKRKLWLCCNICGCNKIIKKAFKYNSNCCICYGRSVFMGPL